MADNQFAEQSVGPYEAIEIQDAPAPEPFVGKSPKSKPDSPPDPPPDQASVEPIPPDTEPLLSVVNEVGLEEFKAAPIVTVTDVITLAKTPEIVTASFEVGRSPNGVAMLTAWTEHILSSGRAKRILFTLMYDVNDFNYVFRGMSNNITSADSGTLATVPIYSKKFDIASQQALEDWINSVAIRFPGPGAPVLSLIAGGGLIHPSSPNVRISYVSPGGDESASSAAAAIDIGDNNQLIVACPKLHVATLKETVKLAKPMKHLVNDVTWDRSYRGGADLQKVVSGGFNVSGYNIYIGALDQETLQNVKPIPLSGTWVLNAEPTITGKHAPSELSPGATILHSAIVFPRGNKSQVLYTLT